MVLENVIYPVVVSVLGGLGSAVYGAYRATQAGDDFDARKFVMLVPKAIVGSVVALGLSAAINSPIDVTTLTGFTTAFGIGFMSNEVLKKPASKPTDSTTQPTEAKPQ